MQSSFAMSIGITSTYVENTTVQQDTTAVCQDHLHIRGEYDTDTDKERVYLGSPPHTWRIRKDNPFSYRLIGITSTYVENTELDAALCEGSQDHLHIRGEYGKIACCQFANLGSPPHVWRILYSHWCCGLSNRITSTCVENTVADVLHTTTDQDHLHMCGEYLVSWIKGQAARGSPPHVWRIQRICF